MPLMAFRTIYTILAALAPRNGFPDLGSCPQIYSASTVKGVCNMSKLNALLVRPELCGFSNDRYHSEASGVVAACRSSESYR
jgi:hypothetical protein